LVKAPKAVDDNERAALMKGFEGSAVGVVNIIQPAQALT